MDFSEKWYFDGENGCEVCQAATNFYDEEPERPHENCDCDISQVGDGEAEGYQFDTITRNHTTSYTEEITLAPLHNMCAFQYEVSMSIDSSDYESEILSELDTDDNDVREINHSSIEINETFDLERGQGADPVVTVTFNITQLIEERTCNGEFDEVLTDEVYITINYELDENVSQDIDY
ncbi:hypothetical protein QUH73_17180 [Labilibaculum sp. K2S]|uniref:hypothetical protein n=1 Tax=Labilibaculum sp. K2S TaxID=3056386 RepID=UPI0025A321D6|nr:hypothetical protein [Labilibaculum sp. K2S]MDM8161553.1 hypothetical protein [Labilibaculum sp. K2S]